MYCLCGSHQFSWLLLDRSYSLGYRTTNELLNEREAKVLDSLRLLGRKAKLVEEAANLTSSNAFNAVDC
jgi:hypothetical protein